ncbi:YfjI family protein [Geminicoccus flavidas]|uniref:YfjI family protein n=1 Tax=Geminicoccus flavidas TaxID=2506407 RepID=UPI00135C3028|nr:YfjI family protein [Geminicoccus flavidas]
MAAATVVELTNRATAPADKAAAEAPWPEMVPLFADHERSTEYPLHVLPPVMRDAITDVRAYGQQPIALVACSALATASLVTQGLADVARTPSLISPTWLNLLVIAESGERKTTADKRMARAIRQWQQVQQANRRPGHEQQKDRRAVWLAKRDGLLAAIKKAVGAAKREERDKAIELEAALQGMGPMPVVDPLPVLFMEDTNPEALSIDLANGWPSSSLWSDEGGLVVSGHGMSEQSILRYFALLNRLWDGNPFTRRRSTRESVEVRGRRFTASLMMQAQVVSKLLAAGDGLSRGTGFLARFLIAWPRSTMGLRLYQAGSTGTPALAVWDELLTQLLEMPLPVDPEADLPMVLKPPILPLSQPAFERWRSFFDDVECELGPRGELADLPDFGSKAAEQAARIAGVLHVLVHGPTGEIGIGSMDAGVEIAAWHLHEARRMFAMIGRDGVATDAAALLSWTMEQAEPVTMKRVLQYGPSRTRTKERRDGAIAKLTENGLARVVREGRSERLVVNPDWQGVP